ncbi:MAG: hypothetical protein ACRD6N_11635 [Pyrinomonadaceae bacterium]
MANGLNAEAVAQAAAERNVEVIPINRFALEERTPEELLCIAGLWLAWQCLQR